MTSHWWSSPVTISGTLDCWKQSTVIPSCMLQRGVLSGKLEMYATILPLLRNPRSSKILWRKYIFKLAITRSLIVLSILIMPVRHQEATLFSVLLSALIGSFFSRGYAKHRNDYLLGDRLCKCVTHSDVNFWPRTWRVWVPVSCKPPKLSEVKAAILVLVERFFESV